MSNYNPKSLKAEEFINHEEILATIEYAEKNKNNVELIDAILQKARPQKTEHGVHCEGLTHREASVLLACDIPEKVEEMYKLANEIKQAFYGNRIVMFAPLYLSNYCVNGCVYCPYHMKNKHIKRIKLTQDQIRDEVIALQDMGHKRLAIEAGEDPVHNSIEYILDSIKTIYSIQHKNGAIRRVNVNIAATTVENYRKLKEAGIGTYILFQETYNKDKYAQLHLAGHKRVFPYRFCAQERALRGKMRGIGFAALLGLDDFRRDALATGLHAYLLQKKYPHAEIAFSCPRLRPIINNDKIKPMDVHERQLLQVVCAYRLFMPFASITVSSRECARVRDNLMLIAANKISAGVNTGIGAHSKKQELGDEQFEIDDSRSLQEIYDALLKIGLQPVMSEYVYV